MPSPLERIQVLCEPNLYAAIKTIAKGRNQSLSSTAADMLAELLLTPEYKEEYEATCKTYGEVPTKADKRVRPRGQRIYTQSTPDPAPQAVKRGERHPESTYTDLVDNLQKEKLEKLQKLLELMG